MINNLIIYKKYTDYIYYVYLLLDKIPKTDKIVIGTDIRNYLINNLELIIKYWKCKDISYLNTFDINIIIINNLIRIIYKRKYISNQNYNAYSKKTGEISNICHGLINYEDVKN